jgi:hypothetical protein
MHLFEIRAARALNASFARRGRIFAERYHARALKTPREVRNALCYVLNNARHHAADRGARIDETWFDPCSSAAWFDGWKAPRSRDTWRARTLLDTPNPCAKPRTWLLSVGWRRHGLIALDTIPGSTRPKSTRRPTASDGRQRR